MTMPHADDLIARLPVALRESDGTIRAWACPRCRRVSMATSCGGPDGRIREAEHSYEQALQCGICQGCGVVLACRTFASLCAECRAKANARADAFHEEHRIEWEQNAATRAASVATRNAELLRDLPALQARDWSDEEDLAVELVPSLLSELLAARTRAQEVEVVRDKAMAAIRALERSNKEWYDAVKAAHARVQALEQERDAAVALCSAHEEELADLQVSYQRAIRARLAAEAALATVTQERDQLRAQTSCPECGYVRAIVKRYQGGLVDHG